MKKVWIIFLMCVVFLQSALFAKEKTMKEIDLDMKILELQREKFVLSRKNKNSQKSEKEQHTIDKKVISKTKLGSFYTGIGIGTLYATAKISQEALFPEENKDNATFNLLKVGYQMEYIKTTLFYQKVKITDGKFFIGFKDKKPIKAYLCHLNHT